MSIFENMKKSVERIVENEKKKEPQRKKAVDNVVTGVFGDLKKKKNKK